MKKQLIEQLVQLSDLELLETLEMVFRQCREPLDDEKGPQTCLMIVQHTGDVNPENGGFVSSTLDKASFLGLPVDKNNLKALAPILNKLGRCPVCSVRIQGCDTLTKCPYCHSQVECK